MADEFKIWKVNEELGIVFGFGMICKEVKDNVAKEYYDTDNQHVPEDVMVKAVSKYMEGARINNNGHTANDVGIVVHSFPLTEDIAKTLGITSNYYGWLVGVKPDADTLVKFKSGEYTGFSIEGSAALIDDKED